MKLRNMLKSKLHTARVTDANLAYEGSITIDEDLMEMADIVTHEFVLVSNANNGERFETYVIPAPRGSREICLNGATARKGLTGDTIFIFSFSLVPEDEVPSHESHIIILDEKNNPKNL
jgi:aspartate 1-decarboxylase